MEMYYYIFKLNVQPNIINSFKKDGSLDYLLTKLIPDVLDQAVGIKEGKNINLLEIVPEKKTDKDFYKKFNQLEIDTNKLYDYYKAILKKYKETEEIYYEKDFLNLNEKCIRHRISLERIYPNLKMSYNLITDEEIYEKFKFEFDNKIGTGIKHINKFYKLKLYIEKSKDKLINPLNLQAYYNPTKEYILVKSHSETDAQYYITALEKTLNNNQNTNEKIGRININPVYEFISFEKEEYSEISFVIVYPNGNPPLDRHDILKNTEAKEVKTVIYGADDQPLKPETIESELNRQAKLGYLKSLVTKGRGKGKAVVKKIRRTKILDRIL
ncbi:hypothetical protein [Sporosarcina sp. P7]|uniref:hypothetical protein n=1 Tax=Sporosarcina sp. P7 TaxID=2048244 RepID=UPI000C16FC88|nr:hypothetical protein [Sporosarcina sp. P7]PID24094.1 hypothetical protein CSV60_11820 [Sporosarcina sp. P7]